MQGTDEFKKAIQEYLDGFALIDPLFAESMKKEGKSIDKCCTYIINQVKKSGKLGFADNEIFDMAVHYYDEDDIQVGPAHAGVQVIVNRDIPAPAKKKAASAAPAAVAKTVTPPPVTQKSKVKPKTVADPQQFSLF